MKDWLFLFFFFVEKYLLAAVIHSFDIFYVIWKKESKYYFSKYFSECIFSVYSMEKWA